MNLTTALTPFRLQAASSPAAIAAAKAVCERVSTKTGAVTLDLAPLLAACKAAQSSPEVAADLCFAVVKTCTSTSALVNKFLCVAAGVIPAVVSAMSTHGVVSADVAWKGCLALALLANDDTKHADAIVVSSSGLDAILSLMASHPGDEEVQWTACFALREVLVPGSPAVWRRMRDSISRELIMAAKANHPRHENVRIFADELLHLLK